VFGGLALAVAGALVVLLGMASSRRGVRARPGSVVKTPPAPKLDPPSPFAWRLLRSRELRAENPALLADIERALDAAVTKSVGCIEKHARPAKQARSVDFDLVVDVAREAGRSVVSRIDDATQWPDGYRRVLQSCLAKHMVGAELSATSLDAAFLYVFKVRLTVPPRRSRRRSGRMHLDSVWDNGVHRWVRDGLD